MGSAINTTLLPHTANEPSNTENLQQACARAWSSICLESCGSTCCDISDGMRLHKARICNATANAPTPMCEVSCQEI